MLTKNQTKTNENEVRSAHTAARLFFLGEEGTKLPFQESHVQQVKLLEQNSIIVTVTHNHMIARNHTKPHEQHTHHAHTFAHTNT